MKAQTRGGAVVKDRDACLLYHQARKVDEVLEALANDDPGPLAVDDVRDLLTRARDRMAYYALDHLGEEFDFDTTYWGEQS